MPMLTCSLQRRGSMGAAAAPPLCRQAPLTPLPSPAPPPCTAGRRIVASGDDAGSVDLWLLSGGGEGAVLEHSQAQVLHDGGVVAVATAPAANRLASASADGTVRLWDATNLLSCTAQLGGGGAPAINAVAWAGPELVASAGHDGRLCLWDTRQAGSSAPAAAAAVGAPALSLAAAGGVQPLLVAGDQLGRLALFDARSLAAPLQQRALHGDAVHALAAASSGGSVASGADDGSVALLDCGRLEASRQLVAPRQDGEAPCYVRALAWAGSQPQQQLFRGGWDQAVAAVPL